MRKGIRQRYRGFVIALAAGEPFRVAAWHCGIWNFLGDEADRLWGRP